ncbi:MAG: HAMP domain-containing protein [Anaerolineales bacterium]
MLLDVDDPVGNPEAIDQLESIQPAVERMLALLESIHKERMVDAHRSREAANATISQTIALFIGATLIAALAGIVATFLISRRISRPVIELTGIANNISKGDLDTPATVASRGEIGELAESIERMRMSLTLTFAKLKRQQDAAKEKVPTGNWR